MTDSTTNPDRISNDGTAAQHSRTVLVGFLGSFVRRLDGWMPISGAVALMGQLGLDESSVRTAVFRLKKRGWLVAERQGSASGYRLTDVALASFAEGDSIVWHPREPAELADGWCVVNFSVPESDRARRHLLRSRLASLGFGNIGSGVWIAPARMLPAARTLIDSVGLTEQSAVFEGAYVAGQKLETLVRSGWDLAEINARYREFIDKHHGDLVRLQKLRAAASTALGEQSFTTYLTAIDDWRKLPFRDPGLPAELLGDDWCAAEAGQLFEAIVDELDEAALEHARTYWR